MTDQVTSVLVVDSLQGLARATPVGAAVEHAPRPAFSVETVMARLTAWEADFVNAQSPATVRAIRSDWAQYIAWCELHKLSPLPANAEQLEAFLRNAIVRGRKRSTINRYVYTVTLIHHAAELPSPTEERGWRLKWRGLTNNALVKRGGNKTKQAGELRRSDVSAVLDHMLAGKITLWVRRDAALISLASETMLRESELVRVCVEHFSVTRDGKWRLLVPYSKSNRSGAEVDYRHVSARTLELVEAWKAAYGIQSGVLFRAVSGRKRSADGQIERSGAALPEGLGPQEVARIFRNRATAAGLPHAALISGHSARVGMANDLIERGYTTAQIMDAGKWKSPQMVGIYTRRSGAGQSAVADLIAKEAKDAE